MKPRTTLFLLALLNNVAPFSLLTWSQTQLASGLVSILNATTPVFTVVVAHFFTVEEKLDPRRLAGALVGLAGVALMIGPALLGGFGLVAIVMALVPSATGVRRTLKSEACPLPPASPPRIAQLTA